LLTTAVIGAAGFTGIELVGLLLAHPELELVAATSDSHAQTPVSRLYPQLLDKTELRFSPHDVVLEAADVSADLVFLAVPHTAALAMVPTLLDKGAAVIDLSADFRLKDAALYEQWYGTAHTASALLPQAVYGLPELYGTELEALGQRWQVQQAQQTQQVGTPTAAPQDTSTSASQSTPPSSDPASAPQGTLTSASQSSAAVLVANPGCYPTASALAAAPALDCGLVDPDGIIVINAISGVSGAGRTANDITQFCLANENLSAYAVSTHRHTPEIVQTLSDVAGRPVKVQFTPHLAPLNRGMVSTVCLPMKPEASTDQLWAAYRSFYANQPFVYVLEPGHMPQTASVRASNNAQIGLALDACTGMLVVSCAIDNLGKGAASQAVQCANIICGLEQTCGLQGSRGVI
jgi:N-acetyl-gamma-glutamyl-phosphate reductase